MSLLRQRRDLRPSRIWMTKEELKKLGLAERYAHRGYHNKPEIPENSIPAFRRAIEYGLASELDVHLIADGSLVVFHDAKLERQTGAPGEIEDYDLSNLRKLRLECTDEVIPTLDEVLDLYEHTGLPLMIELKTNHRNHRRLAEAVVKRLDEYKGPFAIESFDPRAVLAIRKLRPGITRGQLSQDFFLEPEGLPGYQAAPLTALKFNLFAKPQFVAYKFRHRDHRLSAFAIRRSRLPELSWTIASAEEYRKALKEGCIPIFENIGPEELGLEKKNGGKQK